jgi:type VI protein secretion system component VasK
MTDDEPVTLTVTMTQRQYRRLRRALLTRTLSMHDPTHLDGLAWFMVRAIEAGKTSLTLGGERASPPDPGGMGAQGDEVARLDWEDEQAVSRVAHAEHG